MIAAVRGEVMVRRPDHVVVEAGGVGYRLAVSAETLKAVPATGRDVFLHAELIARDDSLSLFGFASEEERDLFGELVSVSGVGPKVALAALSGGPARELLRAIASGDAKRFQAVPGIGELGGDPNRFPEGPDALDVLVQVLDVAPVDGLARLQADRLRGQELRAGQPLPRRERRSRESRRGREGPSARPLAAAEEGSVLDGLVGLGDGLEPLLHPVLHARLVHEAVGMPDVHQEEIGLANLDRRGIRGDFEETIARLNRGHSHPEGGGRSTTASR